MTSSASIDTGSTAFLLICMALVQLMLPGLAFFYSGLLHRRSVVAMMMQNYAAMGIITIIWMLFGFSICFAPGDFSLYGTATTFGAFKNVDGGPLTFPEAPHRQKTSISSFHTSPFLECSRMKSSFPASPASSSLLIRACLPSSPLP